MAKSSSKFARAKKSLGQNFLVDEVALTNIASFVPENTPLLLEIGPGRGALTKHLAARAGKICLIEKDEELLAGTRTMLLCEQIEPISWPADALEFDYERIWQEAEMPDADLVVAANLPYNVATEILFRLIDKRARIPRMVLMFQKEVAERIVAESNCRDYGTLSVLVQNFYDCEEVLRLKPHSFQPRPKVDSSVVLFQRRPQPILDISEAEWPKFRDFVHNAFRYRRKTLENSLKMVWGTVAKGAAHGRKGYTGILAEAGVDGGRRAETLSIPEFGALFRSLYG